MINTYADKRLNGWAEWSLRRADHGLGYPKQPCYTNLMPRTGPTSGSPDIDQDALDVERCVIAIRHMNDQLYQVLINAYLRPRMSKEQKLKACCCCEKTFYNRLDRAQQMVLGYLNDIAAGYPLPSLDIGSKTAA